MKKTASPEIMYDIPSRPHIKLDQAGQGGVGNEPAQHILSQHGRENPHPDEEDRNDHEGGRSQGTNYVYVARGHVEDAVEDIEAGGKER